MGLAAKQRLFALLIVYLGLYQLLLAVATWRWEDPVRFLSFLGLGAGCTILQRMWPARAMGFPLSLPVVLLSMVELSLAEALVVGTLVAVLERWKPGAGAEGRLHLCYSAGAQAVMITTARFSTESLLPTGMTGTPVRLLVAAVALFVANTFPAAMIARLNNKERLGRIWKESYMWALPHYLVAAAGANLFRLGPSGLSWDVALPVLTVLSLIHRHHRAQKAKLKEQQKHAGDMAMLHLRAVEGLALAVEARGGSDVAGHLRRVRVYAAGLGRAIGMTEDALEGLHAAALLHDIGKLAVPDHILTKPGKLTAEEFARLKVHTVVGGEIVEHVQFPHPVAPLVRAHHEKWDGSGYPDGLKGEEIPLGARILSAADCLDALTSDREYRRAIPMEEAVRHIVAQAGHSFDPAVTAALSRVWRQLERDVKEWEMQPYRPAPVEIGCGTPDAGLDTGHLSAKGAGFISSIAATSREEKRLTKLATRIGESLSMEQTQEMLHRLLRELLEFDAMAVFVRHAGVYRVEFAAGDNRGMLMDLEAAMGEGLTGWVARQNQAMVNGNPAVDRGFSCDPDKPLEAALAVPLCGRGDVIAVLNLYRKERDAFRGEDLRILSAVAPRIAAAIENAMAYRQAERLAEVDSTTQLLSERGLEKRVKAEVARSLRSQSPFAVTLIRLKGPAFPEGQQAEAQVLAGLGRVFQGACREYDSLGYVEPSGFMFLLSGMRPQDLPAKLEMVARAAKVTLGGETPVTVEAGSSFYPEDGVSARQLMKLARRRSGMAKETVVAEGR